MKKGSTEEKVGILRELQGTPRKAHIDLIIAALGDSDFEVTSLAGKAYVALRLEGLSSLELSDKLIRALRKASVPMKREIYSLLTHFETQATIQVLERALKGKDPAIRRIALYVLGTFQSASATNMVMRRLREGNETEKKTAAMSLGENRVTEALPILMDHLDHKDRYVRKAMYIALKRITELDAPPKKEDWQELLERKKSEDQDQLAILLKKIKSSEVELIPVLIEETADFIFNKKDVSKALLNYIEHKDFRVRAATCNVLGQLKTDRAYEALIERLNDPRKEVSYTAYRSLKRTTGMPFPRDYSTWLAWYQDR